MLTPAQIRMSRKLSLVLRHKPEAWGISLDKEGFVSVDKLLKAAKQNGLEISRAELKQIVEENSKKRFSLVEGKHPSQDRLRAVQGHSVEVELGLTPAMAPKSLYHGTTEERWGLIKQEGLNSGRRQYVHLSDEIETALQVGRRHGRPIVLNIDTIIASQAGHEFYKAENGVWLTKFVPAYALSLFVPKIGRER